MDFAQQFRKLCDHKDHGRKQETDFYFHLRIKAHLVQVVSYVTDYGPCFGIVWDLAIENDLIISYKASYYENNILSSNNRYLKDYEVFQVKKYRYLSGGAIITDLPSYVFTETVKIDIEKLAQWTEENFVEFEKILHDFIPLIRWFQIPAKIFWRNVRQFEKVFPKNLYQDILGYIIDPDTPPNSTVILSSRNNNRMNSILVENHHFNTIASWVDQNNHKFYSFNLLYRASRDGFQAQKFHEMCDYKGATIMIAKMKNEDALIGGYNPFDWKPYTSYQNIGGSWKETGDSFLFSFASKNSRNGNIARVTNKIHAVSYVTKYGPCFGGGWDLAIEKDLIISYKASSYSGNNFLSSNNYHLEDYEVFQVIKK
ncbi:17507_t:CDS:2 [Funneliformis geosporum]|nr:17507_t:CDS:2 [Funneliformis geosporum]